MTGELAVLASAASLFGLGFATALAWLLGRTIFDSPAELPSTVLSVTLVGGFTLFSALVGLATSTRVGSEHPGEWLRELSQ